MTFLESPEQEMMNMKKRDAAKKKKSADKRTEKKSRMDLLKPVCWAIVPIVVVALLILDAVGVYSFNNERLLVLGICLGVILLPFFSEITVKDLSVKRGKANSREDT